VAVADLAPVALGQEQVVPSMQTIALVVAVVAVVAAKSAKIL
jgi:hypothetical protein